MATLKKQRQYFIKEKGFWELTYKKTLHSFLVAKFDN